MSEVLCRNVREITCGLWLRSIVSSCLPSCSMLILTDHAIYAARDQFGRTPIIIGKNDKGYVCASESSSFDNLGYDYVRDLGPGEVVQITAHGVR